MRYCGLSGLTGMGTSNLLVEDNLIEWIGWQDAEHMSESAGIKFHNARNLLLRNNVIRHMRHASGIWLDVGNVNSRLTRNVFTDVLTAHAGIWIEASHEQNQVDNNIIVGIREAEKLTPPEVEAGGGSGFYVLGTDKLIIANNLIANARRPACTSEPKRSVSSTAAADSAPRTRSTTTSFSTRANRRLTSKTNITRPTEISTPACRADS